MSKDEVDVAEALLAADNVEELQDRVDEVVTNGAAMRAVQNALGRAPKLTMLQAADKLEATMHDASTLKKLDRLFTPMARALVSLSATVLRVLSTEEIPADWIEDLAKMDVTEIVFDLTTPALVRKVAYEYLRHAACSIALARIMDEGEPRTYDVTLNVVNMAILSLYEELRLLSTQPTEAESREAESAKRLFDRLSRGGEKFEVTVSK